MDDGMDISPLPLSRPSLSGTPISQSKRMRDDDEQDMTDLAEQVLMRQKTMSPSDASAAGGVHGAMRTPCASATSSPNRQPMLRTPLAGGTCITPMAGLGDAEGSTSIAGRMGVRWASHQRQGPRR